jgi:glycosyltransferase involved in cell wall biosynthesis
MNHQLPLVSIITVCLNSEKTIRRTIESVIAQAYRNVEYIIIDGGSTDHTLDIIYEYQSQISYLVSEKDEGISDAFNKGIKGSKGEYIQLLNADDYMPPDKIELSINCIMQHPEAAFIFGDLIVINHDGKPVYRLHGDANYTSSITSMVPRVNHPTFFVRRKVYDKYGLFDTTWKIAMDYEWLLRIHKAGERGVYSPDILVYLLEGGISSDWFKTMKEARAITIQHGIPSSAVYARFCVQTSKRAMRIFLEYFLPRSLVMHFRSGKTSR